MESQEGYIKKILLLSEDGIVVKGLKLISQWKEEEEEAMVGD